MLFTAFDRWCGKYDVYICNFLTTSSFLSSVFFTATSSPVSTFGAKSHRARRFIPLKMTSDHELKQNGTTTNGDHRSRRKPEVVIVGSLLQTRHVSVISVTSISFLCLALTPYEDRWQSWWPMRWRCPETAWLQYHNPRTQPIKPVGEPRRWYRCGR